MNATLLCYFTRTKFQPILLMKEKIAPKIAG